jgi:hypothetical protein
MGLYRFDCTSIQVLLLPSYESSFSGGGPQGCSILYSKLHRYCLHDAWEAPTHLGQLKLHSFGRFSVRESCVGQKSRVTNDGRIGVTVLMCEPFTVSTLVSYGLQRRSEGNQ